MAAERPLQRRIARDVLQEIVLDDIQAGTLPEIEEMEERLKWAVNAPMTLPEAFHTAFPLFVKTAHNVGQVQTLYNKHRKVAALDSAIKDLKVCR